MSCSLPRRSTAARPFLLAAAVSAAALASATPASAASAEQVNRADGSGAFPLEPSISTPAVITDDGRTAYFQFSTSRGPWVALKGLYRRDLDTNRTTQIAGDDARLTGLAADGSILSFTTSKKLDAADKNTSPDLYGYVATTGKTVLLSRWDGANGTAIGITSSGFITAGGRYALFGASVGIGKRDLLAGTTVKVADGTLVNSIAANANTTGAASADGRVFRSAEKIITPTATYSPEGLYDAAPYLAVSPSGAYAAFVGGGKINRVDTATGAVTSRPVTGTYGVHSIADDGQSVLVQANAPTAPGGNPDRRIERVDLTTGAVTPVGLQVTGSLVAVSRTAKFGLFTPSDWAGVSLWAKPAVGQSIPGTADDLPSPHAYLRFTPACKSYTWGPLTTPAALSIQYRPDAPQPTSVTVDVSTPGGALIQRISTAQPEALKVGGAAFKTVTTVRYADGRTATESSSQPAVGNTTCGSL